MAILGKVAGPMLRDNLVRNGVDLVIDSDLTYFDVNNRRLGINTNLPETELDVFGTVTANNFVASESLQVVVGSSSNYPVSSNQGQIRYNTDLGSLEFYNGANWIELGVATFTLPTSDQFNGDGVTDTFILSQNSTTQGTFVSINGLNQVPGVSYFVSGNTLTFVGDVPTSEDNVEARVLGSTNTIGEIRNYNVALKTEFFNAVGQVSVITNNVTQANVTEKSMQLNVPLALYGPKVVVGSVPVLAHSLNIVDNLGAKLLITSKNGTDMEILDVLVCFNGVSASHNVIGNVTIGSSLITVSSVYNPVFNNVDIFLTSTQPNTDTKVVATYIVA